MKIAKAPPKVEKINMKKSALLVASILLTFLLGNIALGAQKIRKPNIIIFYIDDKLVQEVRIDE